MHSPGANVNEPRTPRLLPLALAAAILAVSTASIFIRFAQEQAPSLVIAAYRLTFASVILAPLALTRFRGELRRLSSREWIQAMLAGFFLALHFATWITSLDFTTVASSVVLVSTSPLWVALLSPLLLHEKPTRSIYLGMALALAGGIVIGISDACDLQARFSCPPINEFLHGQSMWGNLLALAGALMVTGYLLIGRRLRAGMSLIPYVFLVYSIAAAVLILIMLVARQSPFGYPPAAYLWMLLLALVPQLIGHSTYNWSLRYLPASLVAVTTLGEPIGSTILATFLLQETPGMIKIAGGILILLGIWLASRVTSIGAGKGSSRDP